MFPLSGSNYPRNSAELIEALNKGLRSLVAFPAGRPTTKVDGEIPALASLSVDLSEGIVPTDRPPEKPEPVGPREGAFAVQQLEVAAHPLRIEGAALVFDLFARGATFQYGRDRSGRMILFISDAQDGRASASITQADLQNLVLSLARQAAAAKGVKIDSVDLQLTQLGPRGIGIDARIVAKKFVTATIRVQGQAEIDDAMNARLKNLHCTGEGMLGGLVVGMVQPHLAKVEGKSYPLTAISLGELRLRDVKVKVDQSIHIEAEVGR